MTEPFFGYRYELEKEIQNCIPMGFSLLSTDDVPEEINPTWLRTENQRNMGSCQGHMLSTLGEMAYWIASGGEVTQFSPLFAYYATQKVDGLQGADRGSTLSGGAQVATEIGFCPLDIMPYPNPVRYNWHLPQAAITAAGDFKCGYKTEIKTYQQGFQFMGTGQGGVGIGVLWDSGVMTPNSQNCIETYRAGGGGHAVSFVGYSKRLARDGRKYWRLRNSWGETWGINGEAEVSPFAIDQMLANRWTVMIGISDLQSPKIRKVPDYSQF